jgi:hypothetical protein
MPMLVIYIVYCLVYIYQAMFQGDLAWYFLSRNVFAIFIIITTYLSAIKWPILMEFMPAILFIYTAVNNLVVLYSEVLDQ